MALNSICFDFNMFENNFIYDDLHTNLNCVYIWGEIKIKG